MQLTRNWFRSAYFGLASASPSSDQVARSGAPISPTVPQRPTGIQHHFEKILKNPRFLRIRAHESDDGPWNGINWFAVSFEDLVHESTRDGPENIPS